MAIEQPSIIYALLDPRTNEARYVGKCCNPWSRFKSHLKYEENAARTAWVRELQAVGLEPLFATLEVVWGRTKFSGDPDFSDLERKWVQFLLHDGHDLTNVKLTGRTA